MREARGNSREFDRSCCRWPSGWASLSNLGGMPVMSPAKKKTSAAKLRTWRVSILRNRVQFLGFVEAPDRQTAEAAAAKRFNVSEEQRTRLNVQEWD
jgi:hypothetical protein